MHPTQRLLRPLGASKVVPHYDQPPSIGRRGWVLSSTGRNVFIVGLDLQIDSTSSQLTMLENDKQRFRGL